MHWRTKVKIQTRCKQVFSVKLWKQRKNCTNIFEASNKNFRDGCFLGTNGNWKHSNFLRLINRESNKMDHQGSNTRTQQNRTRQADEPRRSVLPTLISTKFCSSQRHQVVRRNRSEEDRPPNCQQTSQQRLEFDEITQLISTQSPVQYITRPMIIFLRDLLACFCFDTASTAYNTSILSAVITRGVTNVT